MKHAITPEEITELNLPYTFDDPSSSKFHTFIKKEGPGYLGPVEVAEALLKALEEKDLTILKTKMKLIRKEEDFELGRMYWIRWKSENGSSEEYGIDLAKCTYKEKNRVVFKSDYVHYFSAADGTEYIGPVPDHDVPDFDQYLKKEQSAK